MGIHRTTHTYCDRCRLDAINPTVAISIETFDDSAGWELAPDLCPSCVEALKTKIIKFMKPLDVYRPATITDVD
jgi:hypothetical protein